MSGNQEKVEPRMPAWHLMIMHRMWAVPVREHKRSSWIMQAEGLLDATGSAGLRWP